MWIFTNQFITSAVVHRDDPDKLLLQEESNQEGPWEFTADER
jgi:hypothetical protein